MSRLDRWTVTSRARAGLDTVRQTVTRWVDHAQVVATAETVGARLATVARDSWLYRWLTAEPDPQVVVIDLRETYTVGPLIAALDRVARVVAPPIRETVLPLWRRTRTRAVLTWLARVVAASRTGRFLAAVFEPPEGEHRADEER